MTLGWVSSRELSGKVHFRDLFQRPAGLFRHGRDRVSIRRLKNF